MNAAPTADSLCDRALQFASRGWLVFPLAPDSKKPHEGSAGFHDATADADTIRAAWQTCPQSNIGIATGKPSKIFVVDPDVDLDKKKNGLVELKRLEKKHGQLPETYTVQTPRGGRHYYFQTLDALPIKSRSDVLAVGIDVRGDGGYVVAPGSTVGGKSYKVLNSAPPAMPPPWLVEAVRKENAAPPAVKRTQPSTAPQADETELRDALKSVSAENYDDWLHVGMALHHWNTERGLSLWHDWSATCAEKYDAATLDKKWNSFGGSNGAVTLKTIFHLAIKAGWKPQSAQPVRVTGSPATDTPNHFKNDIGYSDAFVERHADSIRFCADENTWLVFNDASGWRRDSTGEIKSMAADFARELYRDALAKAATLDQDGGTRLVSQMASLGNKKRIEPALSFAASNRAVVVQAEQLDADPFLVGVQNGVVNLADGTFHPHRREYLVTRRLAVSYDSQATAPTFERFLAEVQPEPEMRAFLQRLSGYSLTGEIREHVLPFHYGVGANGKGTFLEHGLLKQAGDYGAKLTDSLVYASDRGHLPHLEIANLCGMRFALGEENSDGGKLNESLLKAITGGDKVKGRFHYGNFKEYFPTYKIALVGNHKPRIDGTDDGIWRRFLLVEWKVQIPEAQRDTQLKDKLAAEMPGILNWCIAGARQWLETGLNPPESCRAATAAFRVKSDALVEFVSECFVADAGGYCTKADAFNAYLKWAEGQGISQQKRMSKRALGFQLINRGWQEGEASHENCRCWHGWRLTNQF